MHRDIQPEQMWNMIPLEIQHEFMTGKYSTECPAAEPLYRPIINARAVTKALALPDHVLEKAEAVVN